MTGFLSPVLPLGRDETPTSYVSRHASFHRAPSMREFCRELGMDIQAVAHGDAETLERLARLTGASLEKLEANCFRAISDGSNRLERSYRGERLRITCLHRNAIRVCPHCLANDHRASPELGEHAAYGRSTWNLSAIRTCPMHRTELARIDHKSLKADNRYVRHDFHYLVTNRHGGDPSAVAPGGSGEPSGLERYLLTRLENGASGELWLDTLPYYAAVKACRIFGCVAHFGPAQILRQLSEDDWHTAGGAGYDVLREGPAGIHRFLEKLQASHGHSRSSNRYSAYGSVYRWLVFEVKDPTYACIREIFRDHFTQTLGFGLGRGVFGEPVSERSVLSIRAASLAYDLEPRRLRRILAFRGLIASDHEGRPDDRVTFDALAAKTLLRDIQTGLSLGAAADHIGAGRRDLTVLERAGHLVAICRGGQRDAPLGMYVFRKADVDAFLERLYAPAANPRPASARVVSLHEAQLRLRCGKPAIVGLILSGRIGWVGSATDRRTYASLLVDFDEVERLLRGRFDDVTPVGHAAQELGVTIEHVRRLAALGYLRLETRRHPVNGRRTATIGNDTLEAFDETYVSLRNLCRLSNTPAPAIEKRLRAAGCEPALLISEGTAAIYHADAVKSVLAKQRRRYRETHAAIEG